MEDIRARTTLICGVISLAIALSVVLRGRRGVHLLFAAFSTCVAAWYTSQAFAELFQARIWLHTTAILTVLLPQFAVHLFEAVIPADDGKQRISPLSALATALGVPALVLVVSPYYAEPLALGFVYFYVLVLLAAALVRLWQRGRRNPSRAVSERIRFLSLVGALSMTFTLGDFLSYLGVHLPPIGAVLATVFLYVMAESLQPVRLGALYDLVGKLLVNTALAFSLAGIFYGFITYIGRFGEMYLNAVIATILFLLLVDPLRAELELRMHQFFFRERYDLEKSLAELRRGLAQSIELDEIAQHLASGLERSRRVTSAALYLRDPSGFHLVFQFGKSAKEQLEEPPLNSLLSRIKNSLLLEELAIQNELDAPLLSAAESLGEYDRSLVLAVRDGAPPPQSPLHDHAKLAPRLRRDHEASADAREAQLIGLLLVEDERVRDAFSPEEVNALEALSAQLGVTLANTRQYARLKERDRLAALGAMSAGLAHEIKNPLGAIKGAAQLLEELSEHESHDEQREFLGIILEEADRLNRVLGSFLDYARPKGGHHGPTDANAIARRTMQIATSDESAAAIATRLELAEDLPPARIDPEQLRQVLLNLVQNAMQAVGPGGTVTVRSAARDPSGLDRDEHPSIELQVSDDGPGIPPKVINHLFVPFFTTKQHGTGLGLAIAQRIVQDAGGSIEVRSQPESGTQFTVRLPALLEPADTALSSPRAGAPER